ncbi:nucleoside triphosphate pyrophosphohydrolase [Lederbergia sp. NSJ-179]|uniref:nucleoside triphosphate pyrophosphohydrolase n=1 Tax=Lederbergia sp. NSJ-179 TaxID=2931402 RepID=UPI001FD12519|nr:nucleoside triphosphate pyrophosphohydrolase [Lederbergia sp. NSJ-179]MCJ7843032.1 nucleoside triphosphate pyrophosphohydrolase [Lederbergia sp. NSJ-179]
MNHTITIIGLGSGDLDQLPLGIYQSLKQVKPLFLRTREHPVISHLVEEGITFESFDSIYEKHDDFNSVYEEIIQYLLHKAEKENITYAVPGHPLVAEKTVQLLLEEAPKRKIEINILGGQSFLDSLFTAVQIDPMDGFQLLDGTALNRDHIQIHQHVIIAQVYDGFTASHVKLTLLEKYPADYEVILVTAAGSGHEQVRKMPLYQLDHGVKLNNLTSLYVPPVLERELAYKEFSTLRQIIADLRGPNGCPWDKEQTHSSLKKYLIEEAYELLAAIDHDDIENMIEELGDVFLQIMLHAQIGEDEGMFSIEDVLESISSKMVRRHPHVFGEIEVRNSKEVITNWEKIKANEKKGDSSILRKTEKGLPALIKAYEYQKRAAKVGFDWGQAKEAWKKVKEEMQEFDWEVAKDNKQEQIKELGDLLFAIVNVSRLLNIHPEEALQSTNEKFARRFTYIEGKVRESGKSFGEYTLEQLDRFWEEAKEKGL